MDDATFDAVGERAEASGYAIRKRPTNGGTDHPVARRGLFWVDPDGHLFELMTSG